MAEPDAGSSKTARQEPTRGERMLALRKARMAAAPPILRGGFRPFFFLGSAWAALALAVWIAAFVAGTPLPSAFDALSWHRHEMLFGFVGAIVAGREVLAAKNRNLPLVALVLLFGLANAADYAGVAGALADREAGVRAGIALVVMMISLVGGRIVPSFTRNWMSKQGWTEGLPGQPSRFDQLVLAATGLAMLAWLFAPGAHATGAMLVVAGLLQLVRLARWRGWRTARDPLVLVLHVGYLWVPMGLLLLGASLLHDEIPRTAAIHALTAGAMATMILAVMTRATLGHTGRELRANKATAAIYILITLAALVRVAAPLGLVGYRAGMEAAGGLWIAAFVVFLLAYGPILFRSRLGDPSQ